MSDPYPGGHVFTRIAIVNRGEAAMRLIHAVRDLNAAGQSPRIETVALHTEGEKSAMFVREADIAYNLGAASARPYLDYAVLEKALVDTGADAAWVGWGFVAEDPNFAELCERIGVTFIGPSAEAMRQLGDKIGSKLIAEEVGVPVAPWSGGGVDTLEDATAAAARVGYPLMLKATAGGGGRGIRKVTSDAELADAYERTRDEAQRAFGSGIVFLERLVTGARHVEVQVIADGQGTAWALGVRDCSVQRRNQKVIEESASPILTPEQVAEVKGAAERLAVRVGYAGACTVEFLYHPHDQFFAFLEVNTRLQVEHPITEVTTDTDLVKLQIHVASGGRLEGDKPAEVGHAVEARLNAEDPDRDFAPAPGHIQLLTLPNGPGIRVDTGVGEGDTIPADFDSMIAKIIAFGRDRDEALARLRRAMSETVVVIDGGATNKSFILDLLDEPEVIDGSADTGWIDRVRDEGRLQATSHTGAALVAAGIEAYDAAEAVERSRFFDAARGGRPQAQHSVGRPMELKLRAATYKLTVLRVGQDCYRVEVASGDESVTVDARLQRLDDYNARLTVGERTYRVVLGDCGPVQLIEVDGVAHRVSRDEGGVLRSPAPALVVATPVAVGDEVAAGGRVLVLESMKMETVVPAPFAARVKELLVGPGSQVETGAPLARLEPLSDAADEAAEASEERPDLDLPTHEAEPSAAQSATEALADLKAMMLGFDIDPDDERASLASYLAARDDLAAAGTVDLLGEAEVLSTFADVADLARNRPVDGEANEDTRVHSPREYFHTYLRSLDVEREKLPTSFATRLSTVLGHYGVTELTPSPQLEEAVFRVFLLQQRWVPETAVITAILQRWLADPRPTSAAGPALRSVLDKLMKATQRRFPVVGDLARAVRYRWFDEPIIEAERALSLSQVPDLLEHLQTLPDGPARTAVAEELIAVPERLVGVMARRLASGVVPDEEPLLGILAQRHYRGYQLENLVESTEQGYPLVTLDYVIDDRPTRFVSSLGSVDDLAPGSTLCGVLTDAVASRREGQHVAIDLYLTCPSRPASADDEAAELAAAVAQLPFFASVRRLAICTLPADGGIAGYFLFRPGPEGTAVEDRVTRDVHPMVGRQLKLWRLANFSLERLAAPRNVLLLKATAKQNPADQRLVAVAQVRQLSVVRDAAGHVTGLPHLERALVNCVESIRRARTGRRKGNELDHNHVWIHVWGEIHADLRELVNLQQAIAPATADAGITEVLLQAVITRPGSSVPVPTVVRFSAQPGYGVRFQIEDPPTALLEPITGYQEKVMRARRRGQVYPYELFSLVSGSRGTAVELDLDDTGALVPVDREPGNNTSGIIVADVSTPSERYPEGVRRIVLFGDPLKSLGSIGEAEAARIVAALDLADAEGIPVDWFTLSSGARIAMNSGTENMDAVARALKRIVEFTQDGREINVIVAGINVGAQPYWNAEATMLMHCRGVLIMTPDSAMVLTGKQSLDFSGGVSAEDNFGIGGYDRVMGPNGQAQYWAPDLAGAQAILMDHHAHTWVAPGEAGPRPAVTTDPDDRDVSDYPHAVEGSEFATIGEVFSVEKNPDRKKPFDIRTVLRAVADADHEPLERWRGMADADTSVVFDAHLGGMPVCLIGIESKPVSRRGLVPTDGPDTYTAGTLVPRSSKKTARAINAASGNRPLVVLANLSGFDGSPESMRNLQLEYGAEIGRAIVNFDGPIVFVVISRYHGGAFVVFSKALNPRMTVLALEGSFASVIGGAPAAAVVFSREVDQRTDADPRVASVRERMQGAASAERAAAAADLEEVRAGVRAEKLGEVASEFDGIHSIHRAVEVGSVDEVISVAQLRPRVIEVLRQG